MREEVTAIHLGSRERRAATIDDETSKLVDKDGNELNFRFWTYESKHADDLSPGFVFLFFVLIISGIIAAYQIFTGGLR